MVIELSIVEWVLLGALALAFLLQVYFYARYMCAPARRMRKENKSPITNDQSPIDSLPGVSVILSAHNESYNRRMK